MGITFGDSGQWIWRREGSHGEGRNRGREGEHMGRVRGMEVWSPEGVGNRRWGLGLEHRDTPESLQSFKGKFSALTDRPPRVKGTWWQAACPDPRMPCGLHGTHPIPIPPYSSESGFEMMGVKMCGRAAVDHGSVFHGILLLEHECEGHDDSFE